MKKNNIPKKPQQTFKTKDYSNFMFFGVTNEPNKSPHSTMYFDVVNLETYMTYLYMEHQNIFDILENAMRKANKNAYDIKKKENQNNELIDKLTDDGSKLMIDGVTGRIYKVN